jgi:hypothetical protein
MIRIRSRINGGYDARGNFVIQRKVAGRVINGVLLMILIVAVISALFRGESISNAGIILFTLFFLATLFNAGENRRYRFSASDGSLRIIHSFLGLPLKRLEIPLAAITRVMVAGVEFDLHSTRRSNPGIYKLQVRVDAEAASDVPEGVESKLTLEDSTDIQELHETGRALAGYLRLELESAYGAGGQ